MQVALHPLMKPCVVQPPLFATSTGEPSGRSNIKQQSSLPEPSSGSRTRDPGDFAGRFPGAVGPLFRVGRQDGEAPPYLPPARQTILRTRSSGLSSRASSLATMTEEAEEGEEGQAGKSSGGPSSGDQAAKGGVTLSPPKNSGGNEGNQQRENVGLRPSETKGGGPGRSNPADVGASSLREEQGPDSRRDGREAGGTQELGLGEEAGDAGPAPSEEDDVLRLRGGGLGSDREESAIAGPPQSSADINQRAQNSSRPSGQTEVSRVSTPGTPAGDEGGSPGLAMYHSPFASAGPPNDATAADSEAGAASPRVDPAPADGRRRAGAPVGESAAAARQATTTGREAMGDGDDDDDDEWHEAEARSSTDVPTAQVAGSIPRAHGMSSTENTHRTHLRCMATLGVLSMSAPMTRGLRNISEAHLHHEGRQEL
jgi:hypothetical protein